MTDERRAELKQLLLHRYDWLIARLTPRLGDAGRARDAVHDAYVRLDRTTMPRPVRHPLAYLLRMASNIAANARRQEKRLLGEEEIERLLEVDDGAAGPERVLAARSDLALVEQALAAMPARRRAIFVASWAGRVPTGELAQTHGLAVRTVQHEIRLARDHLIALLDEGAPEALRIAPDPVSS